MSCLDLNVDIALFDAAGGGHVHRHRAEFHWPLGYSRGKAIEESSKRLSNTHGIVRFFPIRFAELSRAKTPKALRRTFSLL